MENNRKKGKRRGLTGLSTQFSHAKKYFAAVKFSCRDLVNVRKCYPPNIISESESEFLYLYRKCGHFFVTAAKGQ